MCQKQCRDENGFKNHCTTENHIRNMEKFSDDSDQFIEKFSKEFERSYIDLLSHHHHTKRMNANYVYNELIQDRNHVHLNATKWKDSLASFVKYLGETGKCIVDETEQGWFVKWIDPEERAREASRKKREEVDARAMQMRTQNLLKRQKEMLDSNAQEEETQYEAEDVLPGDAKTVLSAQPKKAKSSALLTIFNYDNTETPRSRDDASVKQEESGQEMDYTTTWLMPEVVVRIISSKVGSGLKNEKAVILDVRDDEADLIVIKTGQDVEGVSSKRLETVIPGVGGRVKVVGNHPARGRIGVVQELHHDDSQATIKLANGQVLRLEYEDISKVFEDVD
jgi:DNA/RNA-binding protein KIN17